jgi:hypothetical protein
LVGSYLFIVIKGIDGNVYLNQGALGKAFVGWKSMGITTNVAPAAASSDANTIVTVKDPQDTFTTIGGLLAREARVGVL